MNRYVTAPDYVSACDLGPATVLINYRTGDVQTLLGRSAQWWAELATSGDTGTPTALDALSAQSLLNQLSAIGLLLSTDKPRPWPTPTAGLPIEPSWGTHEVQAGRPPDPRVSLQALPVAAAALVVTLVVINCGRASRRMDRLTHLLEAAARRTLRPATPARARQTVHAVRRIGLLAPVRVACLEESAATVLALAASGKRVTWCHGVAPDPIRLHAWVEAASHPIAEPASTRRYTIVRTIPARTQGDDHHQ